MPATSRILFNPDLLHRSHVTHFLLLLKHFDIVPQRTFQLFWQAHHPVQHAEQINHLLFIPTALIQQLHQFPLGGEAGVHVLPGGLGHKWAKVTKGKGIGVAVKLVLLGSIVQQFHRRKAQFMFATAKTANPKWFGRQLAVVSANTARLATGWR